jgi:hypothetical protein
MLAKIMFHLAHRIVLGYSIYAAANSNVRTSYGTMHPSKATTTALPTAAQIAV